MIKYYVNLILKLTYLHPTSYLFGAPLACLSYVQWYYNTIAIRVLYVVPTVVQGN